MEKILDFVKRNKKGQIINTVTSVFISLFVLMLIGFAVFLGIGALNPLSFFAQNSPQQNQLNSSLANLTQGFSLFAGQIPVGMQILGVVMVLGFLALLILIVTRFRSSGGSNGGL